MLEFLNNKYDPHHLSKQCLTMRMTYKVDKSRRNKIVQNDVPSCDDPFIIFGSEWWAHSTGSTISMNSTVELCTVLGIYFKWTIRLIAFYIFVIRIFHALYTGSAYKLGFTGINEYPSHNYQWVFDWLLFFRDHHYCLNFRYSHGINCKSFWEGLNWI